MLINEQELRVVHTLGKIALIPAAKTSSAK